MSKSHLSKRKKTAIAVAAFVIVIGAILYGLADRYLIEHVQVKVASPASATGSAGADNSEAASASGNQLASKAQYDYWSFASDNITIAISENQIGSGNDTTTYYVADVVLRNGATLDTAFAKSAFGRNIIENTSTIAESNNAILAINGDYYGFRSDGVIIRNGTLYRDEPARDALALFQDGALEAYDEQELSSSSLLEKGVTDTFSFGPTLVNDGVAVTGLDNVSIDTNFGNRTIDGSNPRTGIGMIEPNHYVLVVVDGRSSTSRGLTLNEFAGLFAELGATEAYNLDGGGSSTMYFMGRVVNNPQGKQKERGVSDIIYVGE
ncbi:phosphodiester glycosidase family protein [Paenibacillus sp. NEAU-GSW1]|uniref:phosphodiester glycosidase family protein n=1 Tax=Paenibacillus sp. NEAU-GSW1 TaxID=2682486 RepID=UPI0012E28822|nr:phosphodiester glycosidase family protein [Paenibacillus sp. NEAU-GSW1]MUT66503.1 phosphodiester glycosidase family protein [Paenibacillus sp. NEAU-GSW1]